MASGDGVDARSVEELVAVCGAGGRPRYVNFWGHQPEPDGDLGPSCLSQWWPARFETDGEAFASAEHYMMWRKARLFGDESVAAEVLAATSPARAKELGRQVSGFDGAIWHEHRWEIVVSGSLAKFTSDPALTAYLAGTRDHVLVETSPLDRIWGIGLTADDERAADPSRWKGLNLLGFALMEARTRIQGTADPA